MTHIRITPGQMRDTLALRHNSALAAITDLDSDSAGVYLTVTTPSPSRGEALLIAVCEWLNGGTSLPTTSELREFLDAGNLAAVEAAISPSGRSVVA